MNDRRAKTPGYPTAAISDRHVIIKHKAEGQIDPPNKILIVQPNSNAIDSLLDRLKALSKSLKIVRLGQSLHRPDLNKKFSIE